LFEKRQVQRGQYTIAINKKAPLYAQTFGNFEIFSYGKPLKFSRSKTKELLAYLIDRNGATATNNEICAVLWEDEPDTEKQKLYLRQLLLDLKTTLKEIGAQDIIIKQTKSIAIAPDKIVCDSYGYIKGEIDCINAYKGQYMSQYSWAETHTWNFNSSQNKK